MTKEFPLYACVFLGCLTVGLSLGILPAYVQGTLHFNTLIVGLVIGIESAATLVSRHWSGTLCDTRGSNVAVAYGIRLSSLAGVIYFLSVITAGHPLLSLVILLVGRITLGVGESLLITGALAWGISLADLAERQGQGRSQSAGQSQSQGRSHQRPGRVMAWTGIAIYGALACGSPLGAVLHQQGSMTLVCLAVAIFPLTGWLVVYTLQKVPAAGNNRIPFYAVMGKVGRAGAGLSLATVGFGCLASFASLYFTHRGWSGASLALVVFGASYILVRLFFAHLPDRMGGEKVAFVSLCVEILGQVLLWMAPSAAVALAGAALTGLGFSLVFPSFGVMAVRKLSPENKGVALGAYVAFFDLALGLTGPLAGLIAGHLGYAAIYALGALCATLSALLALSLRTR